MKISVIIPSYRPEAYIWECLDSLVSQSISKKEYEIIIVLNGCYQPYYCDINNYISNHPDNNWKLIQTDKGGVSNARNLGIQEAKGDYISFIDDDDFVSTHYLEELFAKASENIVSLCYPLAFNDGDKYYYEYNITKSYNRLFNVTNNTVYKSRSFFSGPVYKLIHKNIIEGRRFDDRLRNGEDTLFMYLISNKIKSVSFTSKNAVYYRRFRNDSASLKKRNVKDVIQSNMLQINAYLKIYILHPFDYSFSFTITRIGGSLYAIFKELCHTINKSKK